MKRWLIPFIFSILGSAQAESVSCDKSIFNGVTDTGEVVNLCHLTTGDFRFVWYEKGTEVTKVDAVVSPKMMTYAADDKYPTGKTLVVSTEPVIYALAYFLDEERNEFAQITQFNADSGDITVDIIDINSVDYIIDDSLASYGISKAEPD